MLKKTISILLAISILLILLNVAFAQDSHKGIAAPLDNNSDSATNQPSASGLLSLSNEDLDSPSAIIAMGILLIIAFGLIALVLTRPKG